MIGREKQEKTLQARVSPETAHRFSTIAKARGMTTSQLVRTAIDRVMKDAENDMDSLRERLRRQYLAEQKALGLLDDGPTSDDEPVGLNAPRQDPASRADHRPPEARRMPTTAEGP